MTGDLPGRRIIQASCAGTFLFGITAIPSAAGLDAIGYSAVLVSLLMFVASIPLALFALARSAVRTAREEVRITVSALFFVRGSAPRVVQRHLLGSQLATLAVVVATASAEPFGILVPVFPMALTGL